MPTSLFTSVMYSNRRPDEEGIKTGADLLSARLAAIPTADLMKKGLRPNSYRRYTRGDQIPTADLMKKGLRPPIHGALLYLMPFQPQT